SPENWCVLGSRITHGSQRPKAQCRTPLFMTRSYAVSCLALPGLPCRMVKLQMSTVITTAPATMPTTPDTLFMTGSTLAIALPSPAIRQSCARVLRTLSRIHLRLADRPARSPLLRTAFDFAAQVALEEILRVWRRLTA